MDDPLDPGVDLDVDKGERRRSERVKREKPDYYDALDYENKRKTTPTRAKREKLHGGPGTPVGSGLTPGRSPRVRDESKPSGGPGRGRPPASSSGRAMLTWKKGKGKGFHSVQGKQVRK